MSNEARPIHIVLLEDDLDDAELVRNRFAEAGLRIELERVESRPTLRAALERDDVDLVIADYSLPRFDGIAALELVNRLRPGMPVVLISGVISEDLAIETLKLGATDYMLKQRLDRLVPVVVRALRENEERRSILLRVRAAVREVRDRAAAATADAPEDIALGPIEKLHAAIAELEGVVAAALGEKPAA
jgi:DNA-binding NtrC family response regulator